MRSLLRNSLAAACLLSAAAVARDNPYDVLGKALLPFAGVLTENPKADHAVAMVLKVEEASGPGSVPEMIGSTMDLAIESPDRLRVSGPLFGQQITLCRRGDTVWIHPGSAIQKMLAQPDVVSRLPAPDRSYKMRPYTLPVPAQALAFLPALFEVKEAEEQEIDGESRQAIDLRLAPLLAEPLKLGKWAARVWVNEKNLPVRMALTNGGLHTAVHFDKLEFSRNLPPETWVPTKEQEADVMIVPPARYDQLVRAMLGM